MHAALFYEMNSYELRSLFSKVSGDDIITNGLNEVGYKCNEINVTQRTDIHLPNFGNCMLC